MLSGDDQPVWYINSCSLVMINMSGVYTQYLAMISLPGTYAHVWQLIPELAHRIFVNFEEMWLLWWTNNKSVWDGKSLDHSQTGEMSPYTEAHFIMKLTGE